MEKEKAFEILNRLIDLCIQKGLFQDSKTVLTVLEALEYLKQETN